LAAVNHTTVHVTKLPIGTICFAKPGLTEDFYILQKEEFVITCYMCDTYTGRKAKHTHKRQTHLLLREDVT
jgi:hypothetical protein